MEDYLRESSGSNLLSLGNKRAELIASTLGVSSLSIPLSPSLTTFSESSPPPPPSQYCVHTQTSWDGEEAGRMYVKVTSCYSDTISPDLRSAVEDTIG